MTKASPSLGRFVLQTFLWLPLCFAVWSWAAPYHATLIGKLACLLIDQFKFGMVTALEQQGSQLLFVTSIKVFPMPGQAALLLPEVNPLVYSIGLALFVALMLASRAAWWKFALGALLLLLPQSWGVAFDLLAQVGIKSGAEISALTGLSRWSVEIIAVGYQLGFLIFPCLIPVMLWATFCRGHVAALVGSSPMPAATGSPGAAEYNISLSKQGNAHESQRSAQQSHVQVGRPLPP